MLGLVLLAMLAAPEPAVLRVGMDTRSRPWAFVPGLDYAAEDYEAAPRVSPAQLEQIVGVDVDVLKALCARLGVTPRIVPVAWNSIEQGLLDGKYDVFMNAWVPSTK